MHANMITLIHGDCIEKMRELSENSVDSIVTDPPYELGFMGKSWDNTGIANNPEMWREAMRVLKPGGHMLAFSGTRTYHRMACAIEDAGFEVRDMIEWVYGSGFPKSLNIGKAVDKLQGNEREDLGEHIQNKTNPDSKNRSWQSEEGVGNKWKLSKGTSQYEGWGTALKPAHEPICMARKPLAEKTVAENCLKWGTGGINIDGCRVGTGTGKVVERKSSYGSDDSHFGGGKKRDKETVYDGTLGRFPANLIHDNSEEVRECFPETNASKSAKRGIQTKGYGAGIEHELAGEETNTIRGHNDNGGNASRFFKSIIYQAKASKSERNKGCEGLENEKFSTSCVSQSPYCVSCGKTYNGTNNHTKCSGEIESRETNSKTIGNNHPTVKPTALMSYLIKMVTPEGGTVLDPFMGSGSTGVAAKENGFSFIGIDMTPEYVEIASKRIESVV